MRQQLKYNIIVLSLLAVIVAIGCFIVNRSVRSRYTYLALGDSYTAGTGTRRAYSYPRQAVGLLQEKMVNIGMPVTIAHSGWTTTQILQTIKSKHVKDTFTFVSILAGTNNQFGGWSLDRYKAEFDELVSLAIKYTNGHPKRVIILSIPDYSVTPFAASYDRNKIARELEVYNSTCKEIARAHGCVYIDITSLSRKHGSDKAYLAKDELHLSTRAYGEWASLIAANMLVQLPPQAVK